MSRYQIPKQRTRVEIRVSNSRFISTVAPCATTKKAQEFLREIRLEMPNATHHVYAFKVGYGSSISEGMSDDGEPSGTAGPPTLAVLRGADIGDIALVTTRYFGGTKLGTGGLVSAYTAAAQQVIKELETEEKVTRIRIEIDLPYSLFEQVKIMLGEHEANIESEQFEAQIRLIFDIPEENQDSLSAKLLDLSAGKIVLRRC